jgi:glucose/mannose-6-phosphate isomerase
MENNDLMRDLIKAFPQNLLDALEIAKNNPLKKSYPKFDNILICGMGGSGIGGKLVASWVESELNCPINFCQDYSIPNYVNKNTLVIGSSNSGNTEETLSAVAQAHDKGAAIIGICTGGELKAFCNKWNYECIITPGGNPPRTALAYSIVQLIHVFGELGLTNTELITEYATTNNLLVKNSDAIKSEAKKLAEFVNGNRLMIYAETKDEAIAIRARQQFNENSKVLCNHHTIPEMNHNELVGWYGGTGDFAVLFLNTGDWHEKNLKRLAFSKKVIAGKTSKIYELETQGNTQIERALYMIHIIDWASLYIAEMNDVDSIYIGVIDDLKNMLKN